MSNTKEKAPLLHWKRNNNEISTQTQRVVSFRKVRTLFSGAALVSCIAILGLVTYAGQRSGGVGTESPGQIAQVQLGAANLVQAKVQATQVDVSVEDVLALAQKVGSKRPLEAELENLEICYEPKCLQAAVNLLNSMNFTAQPCNDFYQFACGQWMATHQIPESQSRWSQFNILREQVNAVTNDILQTPKNLSGDAIPINQVKDFYALCVDAPKLEALGVEPLRTILRAHGDWPMLLLNGDGGGDAEWNPADFHWMDVVADLRRRFTQAAIIQVNVDQDLKISDQSVIYIDQPTFILPRAMLLNEANAYAAELDAYSVYIKELVQHLLTRSSNGEDGGGQRLNANELDLQISQLIEFEIGLAKISTKDEDRSDFERMYNKKTLKEWQNETEIIGGEIEDLAWDPFLKSVFSSSSVILYGDTETLVVQELEYFRQLIPLLRATSRRTIANYLHLRLVHALAGETTQALRDIVFKFQKVFTGARTPKSRPQTCADSANIGFGMAIGLKYIETVFDDSAKSTVNQMVEELRVAFNGILIELANATAGGWMDGLTLTQAQTKLRVMSKFMAYPDWLEDRAKLEEYYEGLTVTDEDHLANAESLWRWHSDKALKKLRGRVDKDSWLSYPGVVNAFYNPTRNSITFPAGILQQPFFVQGFPGFLNYGGIAATIGHEITHGFDNSGRQFDENGNLDNWWTSETLTKFVDKSKCIEEQYSEFKPAEVDVTVNGKLTLGENIADNGGLRQAYLAYQEYIRSHGNVNPDKRLPGLEQFDQEQLFFVGYANNWCENVTPQALEHQLLTDPHSPAQFRVQGPLVNNEIFSQKWNCPIGSGMNPNPDKRCRLW